MNVLIVPVGMLGTNCYILACKDNSCALIDPGGQAEKLASILEQRQYTPKYILFTHGHWDHTGAAKALMEKYPQAECYIGKGDKELLVDKSKMISPPPSVNENDLYIPEAKELEDGQELMLGELKIKVMETPGHSLGSVCYICEDVIFSGDTLFFENVGRCDLYGGNLDTLRGSLSKLCGLEGGYTVYPGHGEATTLDHERKHNYYIQNR